MILRSGERRSQPDIARQTSLRSDFRLDVAAAPAGGDERVAQEAGDGHRADAAGNRGDRAGDALGLGESNVADQLRFSAWHGDPVDANIDDDGAWFDPI